MDGRGCGVLVSGKRGKHTSDQRGVCVNCLSKDTGASGAGWGILPATPNVLNYEYNRTQNGIHVSLIMDDVIKVNVNSTAGKGGLVMGSNQLASASHVADWLGCTLRGVQAVQKEEGWY